ncbi:MerR family transcriptional regulator [Anaerotignum sp.]|uniref:MerR family transcriptional regulator n=1 Tax=Anaerotignum sp. TaxID=2039241 RepID=UPI0029D914AD|nr:MerR family transcriptional regulator [Anaerotignum sp.]MCI6057012.1 MerR family transcriptional regulator [Clostridia bacterium]MDY3594909.1 MerR family transcriptional regulator [Anaerotignum sp.]
MKKFLTIGEVSKIKRVSAKSLRYYEKLGILIPAYTNKETGYRYYTVEQLLIIELIHICVELGIPLKNFKTYITSQESIDIQKLLADGEEIVNDKIKKLEGQKQFLSNVFTHVMRTNAVKDTPNEFIEDIPDRYFLTIDYKNDLSDYNAVNLEYSKLFEQSMNLGIADNFNQGFFARWENRQCIKQIFLEIPNPHRDIENLYFLPGGKFLCKILPFEEFANIKAQTDFCIVQELFDLKISPHERLIEIQEPVSSEK